jgi:hypothetical protein
MSDAREVLRASRGLRRGGHTQGLRITVLSLLIGASQIGALAANVHEMGETAQSTQDLLEGWVGEILPQSIRLPG